MNALERIVGNRDALPWHPQYLEDLGVLPSKARIYKIEDDGVPEEPWLWQLDGYAVVDGQFAVSSTCWNFPTWHDAVMALPEFWRAWEYLEVFP